MNLHGKNIIAGEPAAAGAKTFSAVDPSSGMTLEPIFYEASEADVNRAAEAAEAAFHELRRKSPHDIAALLEAIGAEIMALGDELIQRANKETGLPEARLTGERGRTTGQLKMFADLIREGSWVDARIDRAQPDRKPLPRPDVRRMLIPAGPVVVFSASNFPFAFSAAGGDTASALAAGCPVVLKTHPAHPGTSELVMRAAQAAIERCKMPRGLISMIHAVDNRISLALVAHPLIKAVGFTGSLRAGRAIYDAAARRPEPIPVYAEMGSINPVFVLPGALAERGDEIAAGLVQSVTLGVGQFCTNPGLVIGLKDAKFQSFAAKTAQLIGDVAPGTMLYKGIRERYDEGVAELQKLGGVKVAGKAKQAADAQKTQGAGHVFTTDAATFLKNEKLREEVFGPSTLLVECESVAEAEKVARSIPGQLTATIHGTNKDLGDYRALVEILTQKAGRVIYNGFPTGVEVCAAMQHGGPYPATTDARVTSVGTGAILRFARPVAYQNFPQELLPVELQNKNERKIWRLVDNEVTKADV